MTDTVDKGICRMFILDDQIGFNVYRVALLFRRELIRALREYDLSPEQWQVLATLWEKSELSQTQIMHLTLQDAPSVSRTIARLERKRLIKKDRSDLDKRTTLVKLTKIGENLRYSLPTKLFNHFTPYLNKVNATDQEMFLTLLRKFRMAFHDIE